MKKVLKTTGWVLVALFVLYTFYFLWEQSQPEPVVYELISPQQRDIEKKTVATGTIEARNQVELKPLATGVVGSLLVKAGDFVHVGDLVATIRIIPDMAQLNEAHNQVEAARIILGEEEREFNRLKSLFKKGVVSREEYEQKEARLASAQESLKGAETQVEVITRGQSARSGSVSTTDLRSTISGLVLSVPVKEGTSVSGTSAYTEGTTVAKVADMSDIIFRGYIDETQVNLLHEGMDMQLTLGSIKDVSLPARLEYISPEGETRNGAKMFKLEGTVQVPVDVTIRSGFSAAASILLDHVANALSCDEACIEFDGNDAYVYVLTSDPADDEHQQFERRSVSIGLSDGYYIELKDGVKAGELLRGNQK